MAILIIPAAGRATRMGDQPANFSKALLPLSGSTLLGRTLTAAHGLHVRVITRPDDDRLHQYLDHVPNPAASITAVPAPFEPYPATVLRALGDDQAAGIIDGDVANDLDGLAAYFEHCQDNPDGTDITLAVTTAPLTDDAGTIWWSWTGPHHVGRDITAPDAWVAGAYWLRPRATAALRAAVDAGQLSFARFLADYPQNRIDAVPIAYGYNVNTPDILDKVRARSDARQISVAGGLLLRTWRPDDLNALAGLFAEPSFSWHPYGRTRTRQEAKAFISQALEHWTLFGIGRFALTDAETEELLGYAGLTKMHWPADIEGLEFGIRLGVAARRGATAEIVGRACIVDAFERTGVDAVYSTIESTNGGALVLADRLEFRETGRASHPKHGTPHIIFERRRATKALLPQQHQAREGSL